MTLYVSEALALDMKGLEELKIQERKIIWKILGSRQTEEGYRLQTKSTKENHSNIEKDIS